MPHRVKTLIKLNKLSVQGSMCVCFHAWSDLDLLHYSNKGIRGSISPLPVSVFVSHDLDFALVP